MTAHVVVTGGAFIGSHLCARLCADGHRVTCLIILDIFTTPAMKQDNLALLQQIPSPNRLVFYQGDIRDLDTLHQFFQAGPIDVIIHLAARAGVRPSIEQTLLYGDINVQGTLNLLECCGTVRARFCLWLLLTLSVKRREAHCRNRRCGMPVSPYRLQARQ